MSAARRRRWPRIVVALGLLAGVGLALGLAVYVLKGPEFVSRALSTLLGRPVEIGTVQIHLGTSLEIELGDVRVFEHSADAEPALRIRRLQMRQSWALLLIGQLLPRRWTLDSPHLRIRSAAAGAGAPIRLDRMPPLDLRILDGAVTWQLGEGSSLGLREIQLRARRSPLGGRATGRLTAVIERAGRGVGSLDLAIQGNAERLSIEGEVRDLRLAALPLGLPARSAGTAAGRVTLQRSEGRIWGSVDLDVTGLRVELPAPWQAIEPQQVHVSAEAEWQDGILTLRPRPLRLDDIQLSGEVRVEPAPAGRVVGTLELAPFRLGRPGGRLQLLRLMALRYRSWQRMDERAEDGHVEDFELRFDLPREGLGEALAFRRVLAPEELSLSLRLRDAVYRPNPSSEPLKEVSGELRIRGNKLEIHHLRMQRGGQPLPEIELEVEGMQRLVRLPSEERGTPAGPGVPLPGLGPAFAALSENRREGEPALEVELEDFRIGYPAFVLPIRDLSGRLRFAEGRIEIEADRAVLGGAPASFHALWDYERDQVRVRVRYGEGDAATAAPAGPGWAEGRIRIAELPLGRWRILEASTRLSVQGARVSLQDLRGRLAGGQLRAHGSLDLDESGGAPFDLEVEVTGSDVAVVRGYLGMQEGTMTGRGDAVGRLAGRLEPGSPFIAQADLGFEVSLERGTLEKLPAALALARLPSLQGVGALFGQPLPYDTITAQLTVQNGKLRTEEFALMGPELRILAAGEIDLLSADLHTRMQIALLFLRTVDWMIEQLPIVGDLVLGKDGSLVTLYLRLEGPWDNPAARLETPLAIAVPTDWAAGVIRSGVRGLKRLLQLGRPGTDEGTDEEGSSTQAD